MQPLHVAVALIRLVAFSLQRAAQGASCGQAPPLQAAHQGAPPEPQAAPCPAQQEARAQGATPCTLQSGQLCSRTRARYAAATFVFSSRPSHFFLHQGVAVNEEKQARRKARTSRATLPAIPALPMSFLSLSFPLRHLAHPPPLQSPPFNLSSCPQARRSAAPALPRKRQRPPTRRRTPRMRLTPTRLTPFSSRRAPRTRSARTPWPLSRSGRSAFR